MRVIFRKLILICLLTAISVACQKAPLDDLKEGAQEAIEEARAKARELQGLSQEELQTIWAIEYKTVEVAHSELAALDAKLNKLGQERWDCYHVTGDGQRQIFFFKRRKSKAIDHLTNLLRLAAIAL